MCLDFACFKPGMWKRKLEAANFVKAEAGSGKRVPPPLPLWTFISIVKNLNLVQFLVRYSTKTQSLIDHQLQRNISKDL